MFSFKKKQNSEEPSVQSNVKSSPKEKADDFDASKNPDILGVNLMKDEIIIPFDWNKHLLLTFLVLIFTGAFVFEIYLGLDYWEERENQRSQEIEEETNKIKLETIELTNKSKDALSFKDKSAAFSDLLDNHIYWTRFFTWLESNTLNTVQFESFGGDLSGSYSLAATASSFAEASWQVKVLADNENVKKALVNSVSSEVIEGDNPEDLKVGSVSFSIDLEIDPTIFKKSK